MQLKNITCCRIALWFFIGCGCCVLLISSAVSELHEAVDVCYMGQPKFAGDLKILLSDAYIVGYNESSCNPAWVAYYIPPQSGRSLRGKRPSSFKTDNRTAAKVKSDEYLFTGFDRGHMAPNHAIGSRFGHRAQLQTFVMSNVCPQRPKLNRGIWNRLEMYAYNHADKKDIWIITGPIYGNCFEQIGRIRKPVAFFKIILTLNSSGRPEALAFIIPQEECTAELENYLVNIDTIEALTNCDFFSELPDDEESKLESKKAHELWD